jgi:Mg2+-importing ATPase
MPPTSPRRTAWFIESIATQILVIFLIRTHGSPWRSRADPVLALALGPARALFGFTTLPPLLLASLAALVGGYLLCAEVLKRRAMQPPRRRALPSP